MSQPGSEAGLSDPQDAGDARATATSTFVGRASELGQMNRGLDDALAGRSRMFLLMGEPGIGKTRLCDELTVFASARGVPVLWGRAWEAGGAPAYWPWLEVLGGVTRLLDDQALAEALGDGAALLAELVPEVRRRPIVLPAVAPPPPDEARFRLSRTVVALVRRAAAPAGLVLVFDDLHSADQSSLLLLYALARELRASRVLLIATCRDVEARLVPEASEIIARFAREGVTLGLARLDRGAVDSLVARRAGHLGAGFDARIFESTQGNPLFLEEMLRLLDDEGPEAIEAGIVPSGVRDVIRQRLERLTAEAHPFLELAAVAGDEIRPRLLIEASGRAPDWATATIAHAVRAGVLAERAGRTRFSHALVREVLYRGMATDRRQALHDAVGRALERSSANQTSPAAPSLPLMELAHHALLGPAANLARAVDYAVRAAQRAVDLTAPEEAIALLERAEGAVEQAGNPPALRARVVLALGETRIRKGEAERGKRLCCDAATLARSLGDAELLARAALTYGRVFMFAVMDPVLVSMLEEALELLPAGDSPTRARLLARLGAALQPAASSEEPAGVASEAIATARRLGDRRVLLETLHDGLSALMDVVDPRERRALNLEVEALALVENDRERLLRTHARLVIDHLALGELPEADARIDAFEALATELRASWTLYLAPLFRSIRAGMHGRFAEAERLADEAARIGRPEQDLTVNRVLVIHRDGLLRLAERHDELIAHDPLTRRERATYRYASTWQSFGSATNFTQIEDTARARMHLELVPAEMRPPRANVGNLFALYAVADSAAFVGDAELVTQLREHLIPFSDQYVMLGMSQMYWGGPVSRLLANLSARLGEWDAACGWFDDALPRLVRLDARPHLARTRYEFARVLRSRNDPGDGARAEALLAEARQEAMTLGMSGLVRLIDRYRAGAAVGDPEPAAAATASAVTAARVLPNKASPPPPTGASFALALEGEYWTVTTKAGRTFRLKDSLGLQYLARLVAEPGREVHVLDLVAGGRASGDDAAIDLGDSGQLLDDEARADYRRRLDDLRESLAEAESFGDHARASRAREEIEFLGAELGRAVGLGGRARRSGSSAERARSAVQRRIKNAVQRLAEAAPELGPLLASSVRTGNFCVFRPVQGAGINIPSGST